MPNERVHADATMKELERHHDKECQYGCHEIDLPPITENGHRQIRTQGNESADAGKHHASKERVADDVREQEEHRHHYLKQKEENPFHVLLLERADFQKNTTIGQKSLAKCCVLLFFFGGDDGS